MKYTTVKMEYNPKALVVSEIAEESIKNGALAFVLKIEKENSHKHYKLLLQKDKQRFIDEYLLYQIDDEVYLQEEFILFEEAPAKLIGRLDEKHFYDDVLYKSDYLDYETTWQQKDQMTFEQSRHKFIIKDLKIAIVQNLTKRNYINLGLKNDTWDEVIDYYPSKNIDYDANEYVALYTLEKIDND